MTVSPTTLRQNLFNILDQVIATGLPIEIIRKGQKLKIISEKKKSKLSNLVEHKNAINGDPEDLVNINWENSWNKESF